MQKHFKRDTFLQFVTLTSPFHKPRIIATSINTLNKYHPKSNFSVLMSDLIAEHEILFLAEILYLLSRRPQLETRYVLQAKRRMREVGLNPDYLIDISEDCKPVESAIIFGRNQL